MGETTLKSVEKSFMVGSITTTQSTDVTTDDHIKYDNIIASRGDNITLDTGTSYTKTLDVASVGRITLQPNIDYKLTAIVRAGFPAAGGVTIYWRNSDTGVRIGSKINTNASDNTGTVSHGNIVLTYFKPTSDTRIEISIESGGNISSFSSDDCEFFIEEI